MTHVATRNSKPTSVNSKSPKTDAMRAQREASATAIDANPPRPAPAATAPTEPAPAAPKAPKPRVSQVHKTAVKVSTAAKRVDALNTRVLKWNKEDGHAALVLAALTGATVELNRAVKILNEIPEDWSPKAAKGASAEKEAVVLAEGTPVAVREKYRPDFELVLEKSDMDELIVVAMRGKKVICRGPAGDKLILDRRQLEVRNLQTSASK
jgi:hypothetical protein